MLGKLLLLALGVWLIIALLKRYRRSFDVSREKPPAPQDMVRCAECGVHLPKSESILKNGVYYCCPEHSDKAGQ